MIGKVEIPHEVAESITRLANMGFSGSSIVNFIGDHRRAKNKDLEPELKNIRNWTFAHPENPQNLVDALSIGYKISNSNSDD